MPIKPTYQPRATWLPNRFSGHVSPGSVKVLLDVDTPPALHKDVVLHARHPSVLSLAQNSVASEELTCPPHPE